MGVPVEKVEAEGFEALYQTKFAFDKRLSPKNDVARFSCQLLKWIGNKQRFAHEIIAYFPEDYGTYYEPFLGSGAVLGTLKPKKAVASDTLRPLIGIWDALSSNPKILVDWYTERWEEFRKDRESAYESIKARFNKSSNAPDLLFLARSCYGGVIRFRKIDGYMSTPIGIHDPVSPKSMANRAQIWHERTKGTKFLCADFEDVINSAKNGDLVYCDPPYLDSQAILYGAQEFTLERLFGAIARAKQRGAKVALSIDGKKKSGQKECKISIPDDLFERVALVNCGRSMLKRFQMEGKTLESEVVSDRLLLTWR